ncbi:MAG TPA: hypothetical protein VFL69_16250 [Marmoricola sp.]|nr:hypothetical protein [Marmoricola sp.]
MRRLLVASALVLLAGCTTTAPAGHPAAGRSSAPSSAAASGPARPRHLQVGAEPWHLPGPLAREAVVPLSRDRVVVAGGLLPGDTSAAATYTLDLTTGQVRNGPALPVPVHDTAGVLLGGRPLVIGGGNAAEQDVVQARGRHGWQVVSRLPTARSDLAAVGVGGRVLVIGGYDGVSPAMGPVLASRDGVHWPALGGLPEPVRYPGVAVADGAVWVFGGEVGGAEVDTVQRLDPATGQARVVGHLPHALGHEAAVVLGRRILLVGGRTSATTLTGRMWWFDPTTLRLRPAGRLAHPLADTAVVQGHLRAWLVGGETPGFSTRVLRVALAG